MSRATSASKVAAPKHKPRAASAVVRELLLDSAEILFAERGFYGASVRDITQHAGMRLAAINYHFSSKEMLFRDVLLRRSAGLQLERLKRLATVPAAGSARVRTRALVTAYVSPVVELAGASEGFKHYLRLIAQVSVSQLPALLLVADHYNPSAKQFVASLGKIFPDCPSQRLYHGYQFMLATTLYSFADNMRIDSLTGGKLRSSDYEAAAKLLIPFVTSGLLGLCQV
jgi:AcrR family transcriptional regulator